MYMISSTQIKAARAMLDWSQDDLALAAGLSDTTIGNLESGQMSPRIATASVIRRALENAGLEFIEPEGVRLRRSEVRVIEGQNSCENLFDDMRQTVKERGGEIVSIFKSQQEIMRFCGDGADGNLEHLEQLSEIAAIKYLVSDAFDPPSRIPVMQFRLAPRQSLGATSFIAYGNKCAIILMDGATGFKFVVFSLIGFVQECRGHFYSLWDDALPLIAQARIQKRRLKA